MTSLFNFLAKNSMALETMGAELSSAASADTTLTVKTAAEAAPAATRDLRSGWRLFFHDNLLRYSIVLQLLNEQESFLLGTFSSWVEKGENTKIFQM